MFPVLRDYFGFYTELLLIMVILDIISGIVEHSIVYLQIGGYSPIVREYYFL